MANLLKKFELEDMLQTTDDGGLNSTISEDLAEGKSAHKDKSLKDLIKEVQSSVFSSEGSFQKGKSLRSLILKSKSALGAIKAPLSLREVPFPMREAQTEQRYRAKQTRLSENRQVEESSSSEDEQVEETSSPEDERPHRTRFMAEEEHDQENFVPRSCQDRRLDEGGVSGKRKGPGAPNNAGRRSKRIRMDHRPTNSFSKVSDDDDDYSELVKIIYMIHCPISSSSLHEAVAYEDIPFFTTSCNKKSEMYHPNGLMPIYDLVSYFKEDDNHTAIIVVRHIRCVENQTCTRGQPLNWHESLAIKSSTLRQSIDDVAQCYHEHDYPDSGNHKGIDNAMRGMTISPARLFFFHHQQRLINYVETHPHTHDHVAALNEYCAKNFASDFQDARQLFAQGFVSQKHLDKLYQPNKVVIGNENGLKRGFVLSNWPEYDDQGRLKLECWAWRNNGTGWYRNRHRFLVSPLSSSQIPIHALDIYPADFCGLETKQILVERGRKLWNLKDASYVSYTGSDTQGEDNYPGSRFMIDYAVYKKMHEYASALDISLPDLHNHDLWSSQLDPKKMPSPEELMLMPHFVHGFYMTEKKWISIFVDGIHDIQWNKKAYDRLVIPSQTKELIRALVTIRTSQRGIKRGLGVVGKRVDIIGDKGNGLIMLLHGGPGTGKTLTAESVAEIAEMPLYRVTCGDIGITPENVEKYMGLVMHLGVTWNCVLLLDEADVFLEERSMTDLARNSLVSVFLRILEYYDGILILTSNRIGTFDEAFKSRIQVALHFEKLTISSRKKIWMNFIDMLEEDEEDVNFEEIRYKLDELAKVDLNGRQIRNTLTTARQLAMYQARRLDWPHIEQALSVSMDFKNYIQVMQGHTDDQRARDEKLR